MSPLARLCDRPGCTFPVAIGKTLCPRHQQEWDNIRDMLILVGCNPASLDAALATMPHIPDWSPLL